MPNVSNIPTSVMDILVSLTRDLSNTALDHLVMRLYLGWLVKNPHAPIEQWEEVISQINSRLRRLYRQRNQLQ